LLLRQQECEDPHFCEGSVLEPLRAISRCSSRRSPDDDPPCQREGRSIERGALVLHAVHAHGRRPRRAFRRRAVLCGGPRRPDHVLDRGRAERPALNRLIRGTMVTIVEPMQSSRRILRGILAASLLLATTGCELITGSTMCTTGLEPAVLVEVLDSTTLEPVRGGVRVIARDGALADTADTTDPVE